MKKQLLFTVLYISTLSLSAQNIVREGDSVYLFNPHNTLAGVGYFPSPQTHPATIIGASYLDSNLSLSQAYHTDTPLIIYGIAVTLDNPTSLSSTILSQFDSASLSRQIDSARKDNCFMVTLHQQDPSTGLLSLIDSVKWSFPTTERLFEYEGICMTNVHATLNYGDSLRGIYRCVEFYFDFPHEVHDTFYVGTSEQHNIDYNCWRFLINPPSTYLVTNFCNYFMIEDHAISKWVNFSGPNLHTQPEQFFPSQYLGLSLTSVFNNDTNYLDAGLWGYVFPIVRPRTDICRTPGIPWLVDRTDTSLTLEWDTLAMSAELAIASINGSPDNPDTIIVLPAGSSGITITGLDPLSYHAVWLRQLCDWGRYGFNDTLWSDWTTRQIFSTNPAGIRAVDDVAFSLFPNPATDAFTVETVAPDCRLTLFDIRGTELYSVDIRSTRTTIGIADLPTGVYFVSLTSPAGTTTKRLAVDRH